MKQIFRFKKSILFLFIFGITSLVVSCDQEDNINAKKSTTSNYLKSKQNLSILVQALEATNLVETLNGDTKYTIFAPTNDAFNTFLSSNGFANLNAVPTATLKEILLNHVLIDIKTAENLPVVGYLKTLATSNVSTNKLSLYVNKTNGVVLNDVAEVTAADNYTSNGVVHVVDAVIGLPTIRTHLQANPQYSSLLNLLTTTGQPNYLATLSGTGSYTLFAPYNSAITALNNEVPGGVATLTSAQLTKVLNYHVVSGNNLAANLSEGQILTTLEAPQTVQVLLSGGPKLKDANNRNCNIIVTDIQCSNGVIHALSQALRPTL